MTVEVTNMQSGFAGSQILTFADTLTGADRPFYIGPDWAAILTPLGNTAALDFAAQINIGATGMGFGSGSGINNTGMRAIFLPVPVSPAAIRTKSATRGLFSQMTFVSRVAGVTCVMGIGVMMVPDAETGYFIVIQSTDAGTSIGVLRYNGNFGAGTNVIGPFAYAANDVLRIEAIPNAGLTITNVTAYKNGVSQGTFADNSGSRITSGLFGFAHLGVFTGQMVFKNYSGGVL